LSSALDAHVADLLRRGTGAAAELPARRAGHKAFVVVNVDPRGGFVAVTYEIAEQTIRELKDRWESNEDYLDRRSERAEDLDELENVLRGWDIDPAVLVPVWKVDLPGAGRTAHERVRRCSRLSRI
jgi:hypothetical protein